MSESGEVLHLHATITPEDDWYVAQCVEVDVVSQGETIDEALANLREALELYLRDEPAPPAREPILAPIEVHVAA